MIQLALKDFKELFQVMAPDYQLFVTGSSGLHNKKVSSVYVLVVHNLCYVLVVHNLHYVLN